MGQPFLSLVEPSIPSPLLSPQMAILLIKETMCNFWNQLADGRLASAACLLPQKTLEVAGVHSAFDSLEVFKIIFLLISDGKEKQQLYLPQVE